MIFRYSFDDEDFDYEVSTRDIASVLYDEIGITELAEIYRNSIFDELAQEDIEDLSEYYGVAVTKDNIAELIEADNDNDWLIDSIIDNYTDNNTDAYDDVFERVKDIFEEEAEEEYNEANWIDQAEAEKEWNADYYRSRF